MTDDAEPDARRGGEWLTYRYRLGGAETPEATGTVKAPTFRRAAQRILARLAGRDSAPIYLRLRAAGQEEVLFRVDRDAGGVRLAVVPADTYAFPEPSGLDAPDASEPPATPSR